MDVGMSMRLVFLCLVCLAVLAVTSLASGGVGPEHRAPGGSQISVAY
jgi:hypothetical protein